MISTKNLIKLARKWRKLVAKRKRITLPIFEGDDAERSSIPSMPKKGHFVVYTADQKRFLLPLEYLNNKVVQELFKLAEEEFGLPTDGPTKLPCDAAFMEYVVALIKQHVDEDIEKALLTSIAAGRCLSSSYLQQEQPDGQLLIFDF